MSELITIPCAHCGQLFSKRMTISSSSNGSTPAQHSPGCMKTTRVNFVRGKLTSTTKG